MKTLLVNAADWDGPPDLPEGSVIVNAQRPLLGDPTWQAGFRHDRHYAAQAASPPEGDEFAARQHAAVTRSWEADDAWQIEFIDDAEIERRCLAKARDKYGYADQAALEADGLTVKDFADSLQLPWRGAGS